MKSNGYGEPSFYYKASVFLLNIIKSLPSSKLLSWRRS